jgi:predicted GIY-YIG superfamily endonuclease
LSIVAIGTWMSGCVRATLRATTVRSSTSVLLRDRLLARIADAGGAPDYVRLAEEVLGIRNAPPVLARRLVEQALVVEDRREAWLRTGERICASAPSAPGVYVLRDADGRALYVGKANDIRRRLRTHFAARRWRHLKPEFARAVDVQWQEVGSELEALVREAQWIEALAPVANVQVSAPALDTRSIPASLRRDTIVVLPSADIGSVELLGAKVSGEVLLVSVPRDATGLSARASELHRFFRRDADAEDDRRRGIRGLSPLVFSWLAGRGGGATRLDPHDVPSARELGRRLQVLLADERLFTDRIVVIRSEFRSTSKRP